MHFLAVPALSCAVLCHLTDVVETREDWLGCTRTQSNCGWTKSCQSSTVLCRIAIGGECCGATSKSR